MGTRFISVEFFVNVWGSERVCFPVPPRSLEKACPEGEEPRRCFPCASSIFRTCVRELTLQQQGSPVNPFTVRGSFHGQEAI